MEQINTHTKIDILQINRLRIQMALYISVHFEGEYWVSSESKKKAYYLKVGEFYDTKDSKIIEKGVDLPTTYLK